MTVTQRSTPKSIDTQTMGSVALGVAAGLVMADRLNRTTRELASVTLLTVGLVATVPFLAKYLNRQINAPTHAFGSRRTLENIRRAGVTDFVSEEEAIPDPDDSESISA